MTEQANNLLGIFCMETGFCADYRQSELFIMICKLFPEIEDKQNRNATFSVKLC